MYTLASIISGVLKKIIIRNCGKRDVVRRKDWLLLALGERIEPIQLQKTLFKFAQESGAPEKETYTFQPYNWGPCSFKVYDDLSALREAGLVEFEPSGRGWNAYRVTGRGKEQITKLVHRADPRLLRKLEEARHYVTTRGFARLLEDVYEQYPEYASQSLFHQ